LETGNHFNLNNAG